MFEPVAEAAQAVCAEAAARAPVETGRLRSSIHASAEGLTAAVRCDCPYGAAVELEGDVAVATTDAPDLVQLEGEIAADGSVVSGQ